MAKREIRILKLERLALQRASTFVLYELADPRLRDLTLTRAELANDLSAATIYWSVLGGPGDRSRVEHALRDAAGSVQRAIAGVFHTRTCPRIRFEFDPSIEGSVKMGNLLAKLEAERLAREAAGEEE